MIPELKWTEKQRELFQRMSEISQECCAAVWQGGTEYASGI